jgi:hypothetical protein
MSSQSYCIKSKKYNPENLIVLFYRQKKAGKRGTFNITNLEGLEIPNKEEAKINKEILKNLIKDIHRYTCTDSVRTSYVNKQFSENQLYMILFDTSDQTANTILERDSTNAVISSIKGKPVSFILGHTNYRDDNNKYSKEAYLDVICACPGSGRYLLQYFIDFAETNRYKAVSLKAIPTVLTYYPKFGFEHRHSCKKSEKVIIPPKELYDEKYRDEKYKEIDNIYDDDDYYKYQMLLRKNGFGDFSDGCTKTKMTKEQFGDNDCGGEGYMMRKCL